MDQKTSGITVTMNMEDCDGRPVERSMAVLPSADLQAVIYEAIEHLPAGEERIEAAAKVLRRLTMAEIDRACTLAAAPGREVPARLPEQEEITIGGDVHAIERRGVGTNRRTHVMDDEGDPWFSLPGDASAEMVQTVAAIWERASRRGEAWGRAKLQNELRELLGAAPLPRDGE